MWTTIKVSLCYSALKPFFHQKYSLALFLPCSSIFPPLTALEPERRDCNVMTVMIILWKSGETTLEGPKICKKSPWTEQIWLF